MSPVFRHGMLRLYLLRLLDEEPRHGYEVIRQLRDQFMGVYAPSPGTIYPRLARLEEEGLVTHDEVEGRKVYRITEAGREELRKRGPELNELEAELHASVSDIVREVKEDVRETVRNLREELTWATRGVRHGGAAEEHAAQARESAARESAGRESAARESREQAEWSAYEQARAAYEQARVVRDEARAAFREKFKSAHSGARSRHEEWRAAFRAESAPDEHSGWPGWTEWSRWTDWPGRKHWHGPHDLSAFRDFERLAREFVGDLRKTALDSTATGTDVMGNLREILEDTLERIKTELFGGDETGKDSPRGAPRIKDAPEPPEAQGPTS